MARKARIREAVNLGIAGAFAREAYADMVRRGKAKEIARPILLDIALTQPNRIEEGELVRRLMHHTVAHYVFSEVLEALPALGYVNLVNPREWVRR